MIKGKKLLKDYVYNTTLFLILKECLKGCLGGQLVTHLTSAQVMVSQGPGIEFCIMLHTGLPALFFFFNKTSLFFIIKVV